MPNPRADTSWGVVLSLALTPGDRSLVDAAFPGSVAADFVDLGLAPSFRIRADEAVRAAARCGPAHALLVTSSDLTHPDLRSLVGFSDRASGAAVVSFARLRAADDAVTLRRLSNVAAHERGHLRGLGHCDVPGCLMRNADGPAALDARGDAPCVVCSATGLAPRRALRRLLPGVHR